MVKRASFGAPCSSSPPTRAADRRRGAVHLLRAVGAGGSPSDPPRGARQRLEDELCRALGARAVVVRDDPVALTSPPPQALCADVPTTSGGRARIEAIFDGPPPLDDWTCQLMDAAAHLAAMVLELERMSGAVHVRSAKPHGDGAAPLIGSSDAIRRLRQRVERVAATDFTILIEGESGAGKELVARQIHELSRRRRGPFVAVNCAAIVETLLEAELFGIEDRTATGVRGRRGKFEHADDGTLFLDEISDLSPAAQAKLLRAIQDLSVERVGGCTSRRVDTRIVVATNRPLAGLVSDGRFRTDLFYRLNGVEVQVPPLRDRPEDVVELARYFLERHRAYRHLRLSEAAMDALTAYEWPGNVRELERVIERAIALASSDRLDLDDLPPALVSGYQDAILPSLRCRHTMRQWASRYARLVLERCQNNKRRACRELGISYHTLQGHLRSRIGSREVTRRL